MSVVACDIAHDAFIPYIQLHEFEALLFADITKLTSDYPLSEAAINKLKEETNVYGDPEMIDNGPTTAPSKRIIKALERKYNYNKVQSGSHITSNIGISSLLRKCKHFNEWISNIISKVSTL